MTTNKDPRGFSISPLPHLTFQTPGVSGRSINTHYAGLTGFTKDEDTRKTVTETAQSRLAVLEKLISKLS